MSMKWLAVRSFQHSQDLLAAINTLSIHLKLEASGDTDSEHTAQANQAREVLGSFLEMLEPVIADAERGETKPVLGADPDSDNWRRVSFLPNAIVTGSTLRCFATLSRAFSNFSVHRKTRIVNHFWSV